MTAFDAMQLPDDTQVCRCEEITVAQVRAAIAEGAVTVNDVKRRTRAGMGVCQGIFCTSTVARMIHEQTGEPLATLAPMTARPPARLIPLAALAALDE
jgi:NAD(P)H-nitrite reductase large subunit